MSDSEEKTRPATDKKLQKQREEGCLPQSQALTSFFATALGLVVLLATGPLLYAQLDEMFQQIVLAVPQPISETRDAAIDLTGHTLMRAVLPVAGATAAGAVIMTVLFHKGLPFSMTPLVPNFEILSPVSGLKRIYGRRGWVESSTGLVRLLIWASAATITVSVLFDALFRLDLCGAPCTLHIVQTLIWSLLPVAVGVLLLSCGLDMLVQIHLYLFEQKMSVTEHKREQKDIHGAPEIRQERARLRKGAARGGEHIGVELANMCFYSDEGAVGLRFHPEKAPLPRVSAVARGTKEAAILRAIIRKNGHPERHDARIAGLCLRTLPGTPVPESIFVELASAMRKMFG